MTRGSIVTVIVAGDYGKPRPALIVQSEAFQDTGTLTVLLMTTTRVGSTALRIAVEPDVNNGLQQLSHIMIDKTMSARRERIGKTIGFVDDDTMAAVNRSLATFLGLD